MNMPAASPFARLVNDLTPLYGAGEARSVAQIVFEDVFFTKKYAEKSFDEAETAEYERIRARLLAGEPIQYVLGEADFFGYKFEVNPHVLIPRQETEELVDWALKWLRAAPFPERPLRVVDVGAGSGCIGLTLRLKRSDLHITSIDVSAEALAVAEKNARRHRLPEADCSFVQGDALDTAVWASLPSAHLIVSNPPYIPQSERRLMPARVLEHEPAGALFVSDEDPLLFYRVIAAFAKEKLLPGGALFFECNEFNASSVQELMIGMGYGSVTLRRDLSGADRMVMGVCRVQPPSV